MTDEQTYGLGAHPSPPDPRDWPLELAPVTVPLPPRFVTKGMGPVLNQGSTPQCTAYAAAGLAQWDAKADGHGVVPMDEGMFYGWEKAVDGIAGDGSTGRAACKVMRARGYPEDGHPELATRNRILAYYAVPLSVDALKAALVQYGPILLGGAWYYSWFKPVKGILPAAGGGMAGGHETLLFGWDDNVAGGSLLVRNSWGLTWPGSVNGNFYGPYARLMPALWEAWKCRDVAD